MMKTSDANVCPKCGAPVPPEAPQGLCPHCVLGAAAAPETAPTATAAIPSLERLAAAFPQLEIIELIGRGGMGFVFKARQPHLDRFVALKLLPDSLAHDPNFAERFNREGRTLARLNHPNIVSVFDFGYARSTGVPTRSSDAGTEDAGTSETTREGIRAAAEDSRALEPGFFYLLMEYVDGVNLRQAMQAGRFSPREALAIVPKICEALQYAHEEGVLHRDIKPENILLDAKGRVKIADFGIAKIVGDEKPDVSLTATGAALGTPHYMAPEQLEKPGTVDHRADIYSLGVVFYEMLTGELPIGRFALPSQKTPVDPRVDEVVLRTLEKEREKRFQSAGEVKTNVEHLTESGAGTCRAAPPNMPGARRGGDGTPVIKSEDQAGDTPKWSIKSLVGAILVMASLVPAFAVILYIAAASRNVPASDWGVIATIGMLILCLPGLAGTVLGWMGLHDIRLQAGRLRGRPLAVFAALTWPLMILLWVVLAAPLFFVTARGGRGGILTFLIVVLPAVTLTFCVWAVRTTSRWAANMPREKRGVMKWIFLLAMLFVAGALTLPRLNQIRQVQPAPSAMAAANDGKMIIDVWPGAYEPGETPQPHRLKWKFKCIVPPNHLAQILFVRWTNGVPAIQEVQSAYYKVGSAPAEIDLYLSYDKHGESQPIDKRSQWNVSLRRGSTLATFLPEEPPYREISTPGRMTVRTGHQRKVPLVEFDLAGGRTARRSGIELRVVLQPLPGGAIRTVPTERDYGTYVCGGGFAGTKEETLRLLQKLPIDP